MIPPIDLSTVRGGAHDDSGLLSEHPCVRLEAFTRAARSVPGMGFLAVGRDALSEAKRLGCAWVKP